MQKSIALPALFRGMVILMGIVLAASCVSGPTVTAGGSLEEIYRSPGDADKAIQWIEKQQGSRDLPTRLIYGNLLLTRQRYDEARVEFEAVLSEDGKNTEALFGLAVADHYQGLPDQRNARLDKILGLDRTHAGANLMKGQILLDQDKYAQAEPYFMAVLKQNKDDVAGLSGLANVYMRTDRMDAAIAFLDRAVTLEPENAYLYVDRSRVLIVKRKFNRAFQDLTRAVELEPDVEWHYIDRARLLLSHFEDPDTAYGDLKKAEKLNPDNLFTCYYLGEILDDKGEYKKAKEYFTKVLTMRPEFYYVYESVAKIAFMDGDYERSLEYFLKAWDSYEENPGYIFMSYYCMVKMDRQADGVKLLNETARKQKKDSPVLEVYRYYLGASGAGIVADMIAREQNAVVKNKLLFYVAMKDDLSGNDKLAKTTLQSIAETKGSFEADLAHWYLKTR